MDPVPVRTPIRPPDPRPTPVPGLAGGAFAALLLLVVAGGAGAAPERLEGVVSDAAGAEVAGAMLTLRSGDPLHAVTVFSDARGRFSLPLPAKRAGARLRVRKIGWREHLVDLPDPLPGAPVALEIRREDDPAVLAAQLPANHWVARVLERLDDPVQREEFKRQCSYCHQQGNAATRVQRDPEEWRKVLALMGRMGGMVSRDLREKLPELFNEAYDPETAVPALARVARAHGERALPPAVTRARVDEWELGERSSMQHDLVVHPDGRIYSVDMSHDQLYRLDPAKGDLRESWDLPRGDMPLGGVLRSVDTPIKPNSNSHVGPHSLQVAPDGAIWVTLALGNQLARFDPATESWSVHTMESGYYPHTLRFDQRGRIWYTIAASNHVGLLDPATGEGRQIRLPAASFGQAVTLRMLPVLLWLGRHVDIRSLAADSEEAPSMPVPYGIDVAPDGSVWFSQLNQHKIGRVDPDSLSVEMVETPFKAPRRLRFDSQGRLWIPSFSEALLARFDPDSREFRTWELPVEPLGSEVPYALNVDRRRDHVWICGTNSDTLIRFEPEAEHWTVFPLPTRVTYTREVDFDAEGGVWTSNSNSPAWQIEYGVPRVLRLRPGEPEHRTALAEGSRP